MPSVNRMISETRARACASLLMLMTFSGCTRYVLAQSTLHVGDEPSAEVTASPAWHSLVTRIHQVALYAPDDCANFSTSGATGNAESVGTVLQTHCGVEMSEIERALTASGYVVSSWMTLQRMISTEHMTPLDTARRLGAQVLFQVNSLERSRRTRPMQNARWEREYRRAQADGTATGPAELSSMDVSQLRALLAPNEHFYTDGERLGAGLDVNAVMVSSGQTIWFYRWLKVEPLPPDLRFSMFLFQSGSGPWLPVAGVGQGDALEAHSAKARESEAVSVQGSPENRIADAYHALIREVIRDFVERFRGTRAGGES